MAKRREINEVTDLIGRTIRPGDLLAVAGRHPFHSSTPDMHLVRLEHIYLDDVRGVPYTVGRTYFRAANGVIYWNPTDGDSELYPRGSTPLPVSADDVYINVSSKRHPGYKGSNQGVALQAVRLSGYQLDNCGKPRGSKRNYAASKAVLLMNADELADRLDNARDTDAPGAFFT